MASPFPPILQVLRMLEGKAGALDSVQAESVLREGLKHVSERCVLIYCQVGERPYWKDPNKDFRKNLKVTAVTVLLKYGTPQKLVESECLQASLVEMLFSEDEDLMTAIVP